MTHHLKQWLKAAMPGYVTHKWTTLNQTVTIVNEVLAEVSRGPAQWDEAAVQLNRLRPEVQRVGYPQYLYGLLSAARTAQAVGAKGFTAIEFGVSGGNGLIALERHAQTISKSMGMSIHVVGFDTSTGLPSPTDPRDCPFAFRAGDFGMDEAKLRARLHHAQLQLGNVAETVNRFALENFPPVGFIANDLDLYTSTRDSFAVLDLESHRLLPRVTMYFDDLVGYPYSTVTGEWAAIHEFNSTHTRRQLGHIYGLKHRLGRAYRFAIWIEEFFCLHVFDHPGYNSMEGAPMPGLPLRAG